MSIYLTSDLHFGHDRQFLYEPRGFNEISEHDERIIKNWNEKITSEDDVYILGDLMLGDNEHGIECVKRLNGHLHIIYGNHDTDSRKKLYNELGIIHGYADVIKYKKYIFYMSHYPTITSNLDDGESLHQKVINLYGHTHQKSNFYRDIPTMYHVGLDSHNNTPILLDDIIEDIKEKINECYTLI